MGTGPRGSAAAIARERAALGRRYPSGRQSAIGLLVNRSPATRKRDAALQAFDEATGSPAERHRWAILQVEGAARTRAARARRRAVVTAPVLSVLAQTLRPVHGVARTADELARGRGPVTALKRGGQSVASNKGPLFGDVLRHAGVPRGIAGPAGFALDVGLDPTTYVTGGVGSAASKLAAQAGARAGAQAARTAERSALRAGMSAQRAREIGAARGRAAAEVAARRAGARASSARGVTVKFAGREVPGVRPATAAVGRGAGRVTPTRVKRAGRAVARQVSPRATPEGVDAAAFAASRQADREARAARSQLLRRAQEKGRLLQERLKPAEYEQVIGALERDSLRGLPEHLRTPTRELRDELRYHARLRRQAGVAQGQIGRRGARVAPGQARGYFPHRTAESLDAPGATQPGLQSIKPTSARRRSDRRRLELINAQRAATGEAPLSTNVPLVAANYGTETAGAVATSNVVRELAKIGKPARGEKALREGESVYRFVGGMRPKRLDPKVDAVELKRVGRGPAQARTAVAQDAARKAAAKARVAGGDAAVQQAAARRAYRKKIKGPKGGQYVVLPDRVVEDALGRLSTQRSEAGMWFDRAQGKWKRVATGTPGFHLRNMLGDEWMAYLGQPGYKLPANTAAAVRALGRQTKRETAQRTGFRPAARTSETINVAGKAQNLDDFLDEAVSHGVARSGQVGRELEEFRHGTGGRVSLKARDLKSGRLAKAGRALNRGFQNREDVARLATYKFGRDEGLSGREAADLAMNFHIDYGDVTNFERVFARRAAPFWTFTARALPLHVRALLQKPGKFAALEKARQETAQAFGLSADWQAGLPEYKQRAVPFGIKVGGRALALDAALPVALLNELPTSTDAGKYGAELRKFLLGMSSPAIKMPYETEANRSLFFRRDIQNAEYPLVAAPSWATKLPKAWRDRLGVVSDYVDRRTGKKVPGWWGRSDYYFKSVPGLPYLFNQLATEGSLRAGRSGWEKLPSALGVKTDPIDPVTTRVFELLDKSREINSKINALGQRGQKGGRQAQSPEVRALHAALDAVDYEIYKLSVKRKDAMPLREAQVPKKRRLAPAGGGGGGGAINWSTARPANLGIDAIDWSKARIVGR